MTTNEFPESEEGWGRATRLLVAAASKPGFPDLESMNNEIAEVFKEILEAGVPITQYGDLGEIFADPEGLGMAFATVIIPFLLMASQFLDEVIGEDAELRARWLQQWALTGLNL